MSKRFAVVLPAFNEAAGLETLLWRTSRALDGHDYEIIVVDDGSTDETADIAAKLSYRLPIHLVRHQVNSGYGAAIRTGLLEARKRADIVITMDADDSHDPSLIPLMLYGIDCGSDVIVASRFVPGGREVGVPIHRMLLSRGAAVVFGRVLKIGEVHDYTSGYRAYKSEFLDSLVDALGEDGLVRETGFTVGVELLLKADRAGGQLAEVPLVLRYDRKRSESKLNIQRTLRDYVRLLAGMKNEPALNGSEGRRDHFAPHHRLADGVGLTAMADLATAFASFAVSWLAYRWILDLGFLDRGAPPIGMYALVATLYAATTIVSFWRFGLYAPRLTALHLGHLQLVSEALVVSVALFFAGLFFMTGVHPSRLLVMGAIVASFPLMLISRRLMTGWIRTRRMEQKQVARALIYGAGWTGRLLMKKIIQAPRLGTEVVGFLDDTKPIGTKINHRNSQLSEWEISAEVLGSGRDLAKVAMETGATELYVSVPDISDARIAAIRAETEALGLELGLVPRMGTLRPDQLRVDDMGAIPVLRLHRERRRPLYDFSKRVLDLTLIMLMLPLALPVALLTALAVWIDGRPILFKQTRIGKSGRPFTVMKFRTMHSDVDPYQESPSDDRDPRITTVGRFVRMAGLDELPQLLNVWRGDMSLVGPRPEMPHIVARYSELERQRLAVRPGISGLWQLSPNRSQAIHDNLEYDLYYLRQNRLSFDMLIIGETVLFVVRTMARAIFAGAAGATTSRSRPSKPRNMTRWFKSAVESASRREGEFVLVALDQRQRPDEPPSWSRYMPRVGSLGEHHRVKLLVADKNSARIRELTNGRGVPSGIEFVTYGEATHLHSLAEGASLIVTDLPHLADLVADDGTSVLVIDGDTIRGKAESPERADLVASVRSVLELEREERSELEPEADNDLENDVDSEVGSDDNLRMVR